MNYIFNRFKEPSSWAGFSFLASAFFHVPTDTVQVVIQAASAVCGALAVLIPEKAPAQ